MNTFHILLTMTPVLLVLVNLSHANELDTLNAEELASVSHGGRLYDRWWSELNKRQPSQTHALYPQSGKKSKTSWRCKECHGWDYKGKNGAYGQGSHYTGIDGIYAARKLDKDEIISRLSSDRHDFSKHMPHSSLQALALFIKYGTVDMDQYIKRKTRAADGNAKNGARFFNTICARCHGMDGRKINFRNKRNPEYVGTVARVNPWELLHKLRFAQPASDMPSMLALPIQTHIDIVSHAQTLPIE